MQYKLIKHRGLILNDEENSYSSIKRAIESSKYIGVEFDVRITLDKEFIIFHNALFNNKLIKKTKYHELPKYVPKLTDILNINSDKIFLIEIKDIGNEYNKLIKILNKYKNKNIYVMSFSNNIIENMNTRYRNYKIGVLNYVINTNENIKNLDFVCILNSLLNDVVVTSLKNKEIFSYGFKEKHKYDFIYYITDD